MATSIYASSSLSFQIESLHRLACEARPGSVRGAELAGMTEGLAAENIGDMLAGERSARRRAAMIRGFEAGQAARRILAFPGTTS